MRVGSDGELNVKKRPILFSAPMVRAILAGTKTQTRRVVKPQFSADAVPAEMPATDPIGGWVVGGYSGVWWCDAAANPDESKRCPYGKPGDRLWVREAFSGARAYEMHGYPLKEWGNKIWFWADGNPQRGDWTKPRPSIHMPRHLSRITLEVTGVRVERLQDISVADAIAEGVVECNQNLRGLEPCMEWRYAYEDLWGQINGQGSWDANPWVWVVSFNAGHQREAR